MLFYGGGLLTVLTVLALYNLWPVSPAKWILRRLDHSAIYLLIAGMYTPVVTQMKASVEAVALLIGVWVMSGGGDCPQTLHPREDERRLVGIFTGEGRAVHGSGERRQHCSAVQVKNRKCRSG